MSAAMADDGRTFTVTAPGLIGFRAGFSATVEIAGTTQELSSAAGTAVASAAHSTEPTPYGTAEVTETTIRFAQAELLPEEAESSIKKSYSLSLDLQFRLGRVSGVTGVLLQAGLRNVGNSPVKLIALTPVAMDDVGPTGRAVRAGCGLQPMGKPEDWLVTGLHASMSAVVALNELSAPLSVHESGGFYNRDGIGFLFGPVGTPSAYVEARFAPIRDGMTLFNLSSDMSGAQVDPGETRWGQQVVLLMEPPRVAIARWAEWVGKTHGARTTKGALSGWNNLNFRTKQDVAKELSDVTDVVRQSGGRLRPEVIQVDDGPQSARAALNAPWLQTAVRRVAATGARFGLRLGFDRNGKPHEPDATAGISDITGTVRRAVQEGSTYLKIFCPPSSQRAAGEKRTAFEVYRDDWATIRKAAGEDVYILFCNRTPDRAVVGSVDASRIGPDAKRRELRNIMDCVLRSYQLQGRWFAIDNDLYYMVSEAEGRSRVADGGQIIRTWISMAGLSCGAAITFDLWYKESSKPCWRNIEVLTPPAKERTEVVDLCTDKEWTTLAGQVRRKWCNSTVVLLWNPDDTEQVIALDFVQAGLDPERRYAVWSFWDNRFLGVVKGSWKSPMLPPSGSQQLCFTDLDRAAGKSVIIGSSLHIYCGAAEIQRVTTSRDALAIELTDAGARSGDLFVYSRRQPILKASVGCAVTGVADAGENVWRIGIADRQHGAPQRVELAILLPVTRQAWFWLLIAVVVASLAFAAWRYVAGLRLGHVYALEQERVRIAKDLHDDLGAGLTQISLNAAMLRHPAATREVTTSLLQEIDQRSRELVTALDEIVWAANPKNDNVPALARYLCQFTQNFLQPGGMDCRLEVAPGLPNLPLSADQRHNLFLAFKEALHNALRHSGAKEIRLMIAADAKTLSVTLADNGRGFVPGSAPEGADGLDNMRTRLARLGGSCVVTSEPPGRGTTVVFRLPIAGPMSLER